MAAGKLSARQKMINLMYLVFIAMLALNMSKEVLSAFGLLNEKMTDANVATSARNLAFMNNLATKATDEPEQYGAVLEKAREVDAASKELDSYIENLKAEATKDIDDPKDYEVMDKADYFNQLFFNGDKYKPEGQEFINKIDDYRIGMSTILGDSLYPEIKRAIEDNFATDEVSK